MPKQMPSQLPPSYGGRTGPRSEPPVAAFGPPGLIPQLAPLAFDQIIIAGSDEDVTAEELFDWVAPLLAGIPGGRWMSCQLDLAETGQVTAHYRSGASDTAVCIVLDAGTPMMRELLEHLPRAESVTMILLSDCSSQAVTLLDCVARWLNIYDIDEASLAPVVRLLGGFQGLLTKLG